MLRVEPMAVHKLLYAEKVIKLNNFIFYWLLGYKAIPKSFHFEKYYKVDQRKFEVTLYQNIRFWLSDILMK